MKKVSKKHLKAKEEVSASEIKSWKGALEAVVNTKHSSFDESVDVSIVLGIDPTKGEQAVRGSVLLPHGTGKTLRVLAFVKGENEEKAKAAGADYVGCGDLIEKIQKGWMDFDVSVATPDVMGEVGKIAQKLGPRGLLPNKKLGTVTFDVADVIADLKKGRVSFRNDKSGALHISFGKVSFGVDKLLENLKSLLGVVAASKPAGAKGKFLKKMTISSTMGVGVPIKSDEIS